MHGVLSTLIDPRAQQFDFGGLQCFGMIGRWHPQVFVLGDNAVDNIAAVGVFWNDRKIRRTFECIEP